MAVATPARHVAPARQHRRRLDPRLPTAVVAVAVAVLVVNVVVMFAGGIATGVSVDEPVHVSRLQAYFESEWYLPAFQMAGGQPAPGVEGLYVYGPVAALLAHLVSLIAGAETVGTVETTASAYAARHVAVGILSLACLVCTAATTRLLTHSWRWAVLGAAALSALPVWVGHSMFNIKDAPVAAGYTAVTLGVVAISRPSIVARGPLRVVGVIALAAGAVLAVGTRPGMLVGVLASVAAMLALSLWVDTRVTTGPRAALSGLVVRGLLTLVALAAAYVVLTLVYPQLFAHPDRVIDAVIGSSDYPWPWTVLTAGTEVSMPPTWTYLPLWFGAQTPLILLVLALVGFAAPVWLLLRRRAAAGRQRELWIGVGLGLVALQGLLMPVGAVITSAVLYDGTRQMLFVQPAIAMAAVTAAWLLARGSRGWGRRLGYVVLCVGVLVPTAGHIRLFPYDYTWFNAAAEASPVDGSWMTDYWRTSSREAVTLIPADGPESCLVWKPETRLWPCGSLATIRPYWSARGSGADAQLGLGEYWYTSFNRGVLDPPDGCEVLQTVTRPLVTQRITMSYVARCTPALSEYPAGGIRAVKGSDGTLLWGWYPTGPDGAWSGEAPADIGMLLPPRLQDRPLRLELEVARYVPAGETRLLTVSVNGTDVVTVGFEDRAVQRLSIPVPADIAASWQGDQLLVRLVAPDPVRPQAEGDGDDTRGLGARLVSLRVLADG